MSPDPFLAAILVLENPALRQQLTVFKRKYPRHELPLQTNYWWEICLILVAGIWSTAHGHFAHSPTACRQMRPDDELLTVGDHFGLFFAESLGLRLRRSSPTVYRGR